MGAGFETRADAPDERLRPLRVAIRPDQAYEAVREMVDDLDGWEVVARDDARRVLSCRRRAGLWSGTARITLACEGEPDLPSTTVHVRVESSGGLFARDKAVALEFLEPFHRRVC
jgi:hypothetical protein